LAAATFVTHEIELSDHRPVTAKLGAVRR